MGANRRPFWVPDVGRKMLQGVHKTYLKVPQDVLMKADVFLRGVPEVVSSCSILVYVFL
jgi:hypothetical protein